QVVRETIRADSFHGSVEHAAGRRPGGRGGDRRLEAGLHRAVRRFLPCRRFTQHRRPPDARAVALVHTADVEAHEIARAQRAAGAASGLAAAVATIAWSRRARGVAGSGNGGRDPPKQTTWSTSTASAITAEASIVGTTRAAP